VYCIRAITAAIQKVLMLPFLLDYLNKLAIFINTIQRITIAFRTSRNVFDPGVYTVGMEHVFSAKFPYLAVWHKRFETHAAYFFVEVILGGVKLVLRHRFVEDVLMTFHFRPVAPFLAVLSTDYQTDKTSHRKDKTPNTHQYEKQITRVKKLIIRVISAILL
jgi:hypothetical protein